MRCLEKSPSSRFSDAGELNKALQAFLMTREDLWGLLERDISFPATQSAIPDIHTNRSGAQRTGVHTQHEPPTVDFSDDDHSWATVASESRTESGESVPVRARRKNYNSRRGVVLSSSSRPVRRMVRSEAPPENETAQRKVDPAAITVTPTSRDVASVPAPAQVASPPVASRSYVGVLTVVALAALGAAVYANIHHSQPGPAVPTQSPTATATAPQPVSLVRFALTSNVDGAEAVFRGRTYPVPFEIEVEPLTTEDTIRVTAPGYGSRQLNVVLDHSIRLTASLAPEAAPIPTAPSVPSPQVPSPSVAAPEASPMPTATHRSDAGVTGVTANARRVDVSQTRVVAHVPTPSVPTTTPSLEPIAAQPSTPSQIADPVSPVPVVVTERGDVPSTAQAPRMPAPNTTGDAVTPPPRVVEAPPPRGPDVASIQREIRAHRGSVSACVDRERAENPMLSGRVTLRIRITTQGLVSSATVQGEASPSLSSCIERDATRWIFAPTNMERQMEVNVPIDLD
jgi:hypothetical protein